MYHMLISVIATYVMEGIAIVCTQFKECHGIDDSFVKFTSITLKLVNH